MLSLCVLGVLQPNKHQGHVYLVSYLIKLPEQAYGGSLPVLSAYSFTIHCQLDLVKSVKEGEKSTQKKMLRALVNLLGGYTADRDAAPNFHMVAFHY